MLFGILELTLITCLFSTLIYTIIKWQANYFKNHGVKGMPIDFPIVGNLYKVLTRKKHMKDIVTDGYKSLSDQRYFGFMQFLNPVIIVKDLDIIKKIAVKDFDHFTDHHGFVNEDSDPLFGKNLFALKGKKWRDMRATLSPAFTSSKMKNMFELVTECAEDMVNYYIQKYQEKGRLEIELKDSFTRYTNDVIATTAFGIKINSFLNDENEFYKMGRDATNFDSLQHLKVLLFMSFPNIMKMAKFTFFNQKVSNFFSGLVTNAMKERQIHNIIRPDMIHLLMEAKKGNLKHEINLGETKEAGFATVEESIVGKETIKTQWTDTDIIAQALLFIVAGFDTSSILLCFMGYELAINPDIQNILHLEIDKIIAVKGYKLDYTDLQKMKYMDMVVSESLRKWPPVVNLDRICTSTYKLPPANENCKDGYLMEKGKPIMFPVYSIHHNPEYYPEPNKFDPERFSDENRKNIKPFSYLPFGIGPRNCVASRFALMEAKAVMFHLLAKFNFTIINKTEIPLKLQNGSAILTPENGFWIGLEPRQ